MLVALALTLWAIYCTYDGLGPFLIYAQRPLIAGSVAGLIVGHPLLGLLVGATLELASLGVYTYGGATIPDYQTGAIVGTAPPRAPPATRPRRPRSGSASGCRPRSCWPRSTRSARSSPPRWSTGPTATPPTATRAVSR